MRLATYAERARPTESHLGLVLGEYVMHLPAAARA